MNDPFEVLREPVTPVDPDDAIGKRRTREQIETLLDDENL